jgi:hypothetical protein
MDHTDLVLGYLSMYDLAQLRQTCAVWKEWMDNYPSTATTTTNYTWIEKCRLCDPDLLWQIDGSMASCHRPIQKQWVIATWQKKLPSMIPKPFWNYLMRIMKGLMSMPQLLRWSSFEQRPLIIPPNQKRWDIRMRVNIVGTAVHDEENYPEELKDIDEFISVGLSIRTIDKIHEDILGLNAHSIGWHSDDGKIYLDSLVVSEGEPFGKGDEIEITVDYLYGVLMFKKNRRFIYIHELAGDMLSHPLLFGATCRTMNSLFFGIL